MNFEERRTKFREGLHPLYAPLYDELGLELGFDWAPTCGLRTYADQAAKYAQGRTIDGPVVTKAPPGFSMHQYGLASDWDYFPGGVYTPLAFNDPKWQFYIDACNKLGLNLISWEKPHNEFRTPRKIREIYEAAQHGGIDAVTELLGRSA